MAGIIVCVDMDAFFASVEQQDNPALRGKPIAVTGAGERTVITTPSYEVRAYGVKTGRTVYEAKPRFGCFQGLRSARALVGAFSGFRNRECANKQGEHIPVEVYFHYFRCRVSFSGLRLCSRR